MISRPIARRINTTASLPGSPPDSHFLGAFNRSRDNTGGAAPKVAAQFRRLTDCNLAARAHGLCARLSGAAQPPQFLSWPMSGPRSPSVRPRIAPLATPVLSACLGSSQPGFAHSLTVMLFSTRFTPSTFLARSSARFFWSLELTNPLNWTVPLNVSTFTPSYLY